MISRRQIEHPVIDAIEPLEFWIFMSHPDAKYLQLFALGLLDDVEAERIEKLPGLPAAGLGIRAFSSRSARRESQSRLAE